ncbi:uncharacterized protein EV154DRAFT_523548 [Mucor mucedo]|uniref:uncharacterized protein n=1 Tax=Mucor mucedo TaxID=29922 RepID=UPI00221F2BA3|nr:uncharacterized protein EV154DRAFT_523548 [Mucor mucedo]KAI7881212.1 hypothetical protein EV154DRAFT_523548 [Mucor mucedo]
MSFNVFSIHSNDTFCEIFQRDFPAIRSLNRHQREIHERASNPYIDTPTNDNRHPVNEIVDANDYFDSLDKDNSDNFAYPFESDDESLSESGDDEIERSKTYQSTSVFSSNPFYPFKNEMEMKILMFFKGSQDRFSNRIVKKKKKKKKKKKTAFEMDLIQRRPDGYDPLSNVPKDDWICKSHDIKRKFPHLEVDKTIIPKGNNRSVQLFYIKPSSHLGLSMANTQKVNHLQSLPDFTPNQRYHPNQGRKWKDNFHFQSPMITKEMSNNRDDLWIGDIVRTSGGQQQMYIIAKFLIANGQLIVNAFPMKFLENFQIAAFNSERVNIAVSSILLVMSITEFLEQCYQKLLSKFIRNDGEIVFTPFNQLLHPHHTMIIESLAICKRVPYITANQQMSVRIVPISLFSDDTSGNRSKKCNCFDSCIMSVAAFPLFESNKYENHFFLSTNNHKVTAMEMIKPLTGDLLELEKDVVIYDSKRQENVFVIAPVLFFRGDNVRQAELAINKGLRANHPCRFCYWQSDPAKPLTTGKQPIALDCTAETYAVAPRTSKDFNDFINPEKTERDTPNRGRVTNQGVIQDPAQSTNWSDLGFKMTGAEELLKLKAMDPSQDLAVGILHTLLLGMTKYCFKIAHNYFLNDHQLKELTELFRNYNSKALHRNLTSSLTAYDSTIYENELEFLDNNDSIRKLVLRLNGLYRNVRSSKSSGLTLGRVAFKGGQNFIIEAYDFVLRNVIPQDQDTCIYKSCLLDIAGNVVTRRFPNDDFTIAGHEQNRVVFVLDMSQPPLLDSSHNNSSSLLSINKPKSGSFLWLLNTRSLEKNHKIAIHLIDFIYISNEIKQRVFL